MKKYIKILAAGDEQKNHDCANAKGKGNLSSNTADLGSRSDKVVRQVGAAHGPSPPHGVMIQARLSVSVEYIQSGPKAH